MKPDEFISFIHMSVSNEFISFKEAFIDVYACV